MSKRGKPAKRAAVTPDVQQVLERAKEDLAVAERELKSTLDSLPVALRADKQMVSSALRLALDKLTEAKSQLEVVLGD